MARIAAALARQSPELSRQFERLAAGLPRLSPVDSDRVTAAILDMDGRSPYLCRPFMAHLEEFLRYRSPADIDAWVRAAQQLGHGGFKARELSQQFLARTGALLEILSPAEFDEFGGLLEILDSADVGLDVLQRAPALLAAMRPRDHAAFLDLAATVARSAKQDMGLFLDRARESMALIHGSQRRPLLAVIGRAIVAMDTGSVREPVKRLGELCGALGRVSRSEHPRVRTLAETVARRSIRAAGEFLLHLPSLRGQLDLDGVDEWTRYGCGLPATVPEDGIVSYFRMTSATADIALGRLSGRVEFQRIGSVLRLFGQALGGESVRILPTDTLVGRGHGWLTVTDATTDGVDIFVPARVECFRDETGNQAYYRVCVAHQICRLSFGSFAYRYLGDGTVLPAVASRQRAGKSDPGTQSAMGRFFGLFDDRGLAMALFTIVEDQRIRGRLLIEYPGLESPVLAVEARELEQRRPLRSLRLRAAFVENLLRASLGATRIEWPQANHETMARAIALVQKAVAEAASVQDSAEAAARLYEVARTIPNVPAATRSDWLPLGDATDHPARIEQLPGWRQAESDGSEESAFEPPAQPAFRGSLKPELVQTMEMLSEVPQPALSADQLAELLASSVELQGEPGEVADNWLEDLVALPDAEDDATDDGEPEDKDTSPSAIWYEYDEWDFRSNDYRPAWCRLAEDVAGSGDDSFYEETLARHHGLVQDIRRQFERLRPETFRKLKRLEDGDEIDLDEAIEFHVDRLLGTGPLPRVYSRRDKTERSVAVAFLLDISGSTDEAVGAGAKTGRRIVDVEREAIVLVVEALEAIGDDYGIYAFSGRGREQVDFLVVKHLTEALDVAARGRVDALAPRGATRMGTAIRHAQSKLLAFPARARILMMISDGRPADRDYGMRRTDIDYAVHDTRQALIEGRDRGIVPFLITIDSEEGNDYLRTMCEDISYEVVQDVERLPEVIPRIYGRIAGH